MRALVLVLAIGCGGSSAPPPPAQPAPAPRPDEARCHQALEHMDDLSTNRNVSDPEARRARLQAVKQARDAGILGGDRTPDCVKHWTNANVDCVLAANDSAAANACIPAS